MATVWTALYFDRRTATRHSVIITVTSASLQFVTSTGEIKQWPYEQIRPTQDRYNGEAVRLEFGPEPAEVVVISTSALLEEIYKTAPVMAQHLHKPSRRSERVRAGFCAALAVAFLTIGLYRWGIPDMAAVITPYVPFTWEETLGQRVIEQLAPESKQCRDPDRMRKLNQVVEDLTAAQPTSPYRIKLSVVDNPGINAFAAPGGQVVILRGLLEQTDSPEQLAGVLAHEVQHIYLRHTTRAMLEQTAMSFLLSAVSGDLSSGLVWGIDGAGAIGSLLYSRIHEAEADTEGLRMMQAARLDATAMITFYRVMQKDGQEHAGRSDFSLYSPRHGLPSGHARRLSRTSACRRPNAPRR